MKDYSFLWQKCQYKNYFHSLIVIKHFTYGLKKSKWTEINSFLEYYSNKYHKEFKV